MKRKAHTSLYPSLGKRKKGVICLISPFSPILIPPSPPPKVDELNLHNFESLLPNDHLFQYWFYLVELLCSRKIKYEKVNGNR